MNILKIKQIKRDIKKKDLTYSQIGKIHGCSKQYIGQIAKKYGLGRKKDDTIKK